MDQITPAALSARLAEDDEVFVLDVQRNNDYEAWHVPGSVNMNLSDDVAEDHTSAREELSTISEKEVAVTCNAGRASERAATLLDDMYGIRRLIVGLYSSSHDVNDS
jgi:rhodanese-related sulfurtransferase